VKNDMLVITQAIQQELTRLISVAEFAGDDASVDALIRAKQEIAKAMGA